MDLVKDMNIGWNLGNTLEAAGGETGWGNPITTKKMIDELKKAGFNSVRIPVRWDEKYTDTNYTIDPAYMVRVETVVNYALANDMYAVLNIHHNIIQGEMSEANKESVINEGTAIWNQVADHFKDYSDKLIFETINEAPDSQSTFGDADKIYLDKVFRLLDKTFKQKGIPVVMGEFGAIDKNNLQDRTNFTQYYTQLASSCEKASQLVLSGNSASTNWVRVAPSITKSNETTNVAYFTLIRHQCKR